MGRSDKDPAAAGWHPEPVIKTPEEEVLRAAGQPRQRMGATFTYCREGGGTGYSGAELNNIGVISAESGTLNITSDITTAGFILVDATSGRSRLSA